MRRHLRFAAVRSPERDRTPSERRERTVVMGAGVKKKRYEINNEPLRVRRVMRMRTRTNDILRTYILYTSTSRNYRTVGRGKQSVAGNARHRAVHARSRRCGARDGRYERSAVKRSTGANGRSGRASRDRWRRWRRRRRRHGDRSRPSVGPTDRR